MRATTTRLDEGVIAIDTEYTRAQLDASHLIVEQGRAAFVDTGVNDSVPLLLDALEQHDVGREAVDYVFLTHIHLDHAGGAGLLLAQLPNARCVVHPRGARHMIDPSRLVTGTEEVYGVDKTRELYGEIRPIEAARIVEPADGDHFSLAGREFEAFYTEGHARHHYCLSDPQSRGVFTGDSFGISYREFDTAAGPYIFPTTTPVHFDPQEAHRAVDRIMGYAPEQVYLTHYSRVRDLDRLAVDMHTGIDDFAALAEAHAGAAGRGTRLRNAIFDYFVSQLRDHGFEGDRDTIWSLLGHDIELNAQGLEVWLDRQR